MSTTGSMLPPIVIPADSFAPDWAREAVRRLNALTSATSAGLPGVAVFTFGSDNAILKATPEGMDTTVPLASVGVAGSAGSLTVRKGVIVSAQLPT